MRQQRGFTLIELMIVVAVIAILAAIAVPNYLEQSRKGRRADAVRGIGELQLALERWRAENPCYGQSGGTCPTFTASGIYPSEPTATESPYYSVAITGQTPIAYTITATRRTGTAQADDRCGNLSATNLATPTWSPGGEGCN